ncbi:MAG: response regulator transcription factor [Eggerthellaceae bacterium]|jgi:DNA-binding response OmpR family regulator|nr:response regulator transcription factor [Eggerthellaceae bacterium]
MDNKDYTILICDDDADITAALRIYLAQEGYQIICAENGLEAVRMLDKHVVHLVLLDVMMPIMDGIQAAVKIRESSNVPILFLSAKSEDTDRILGLHMGGDDYITKPFNPVELMARIKAALRRYARLGGMGAGVGQAATAQATTASAAASPTAQATTATASAAAALSAATSTSANPEGAPEGSENIYQTGDLVLDDNRKQVMFDGEEVSLTALEYNILKLLMANMDRVYTSAQIYEAVWDEPALQVPKTVSVHIRHIREKIEINPKDPRYLKVIYGLGYKVVKLA